MLPKSSITTPSGSCPRFLSRQCSLITVLSELVARKVGCLYVHSIPRLATHNGHCVRVGSPSTCATRFSKMLNVESFLFLVECLMLSVECSMMYVIFNICIKLVIRKSSEGQYLSHSKTAGYGS